MRAGTTLGGSPRLRMRRLHHSGRDPIRVLLIGDRAHLDEPVPGGVPADRVADRIWLSTRRGVDLDVLTDVAPVLRAVHGVFRTWRLWRYDVVLVALGGLDAVRRPRSLARVGELLAEVLADAAGATDVVLLSAAEPRADAHGRLRDLLAGIGSPRIRLCELPAVADALEAARRFAAIAAGEVAASLQRTDATPAPRDVPDDERERQAALDVLGIVGSAADPRLDDLVELARTAFGTQSAEINFIDHDRQWKMAVAGAERGENPRAQAFCSQTITRSTPTIVPDALLDPVLHDSPMVRGPHGVRFYAAHPIESVDGYRIGSFCIYDPMPRDAAGLNLAVLRDLALMAQSAIAGDGPPVGSTLAR